MATPTRRALFRFFHLEANRVPLWPEQRAQYLTRYLFWALGLAYFNFGGPYPHWPDLAAINSAYAVYFVLNLAYVNHARWRPRSPWRWRVSMWTDVLMVSFSLIADVSAVPPALVAYIAVVLGNGMRYGMRFFREAMAASFVCGSGAFYFYYTHQADKINLGTVFMITFGGIIILYSYALMDRIEQARRQLESDSSRDPLTGLLNRRALLELAQPLFDELPKNGTRIAVLFADLNKFKSINDTHGHAAGDRVLAQIARVIGESIRKSDIAARYGGDEFVVLLPQTDAARAHALAARLQAAVEQWARTQSFQVSIAIGVGEAPSHGQDLDAVLSSVDRALYRQKSGNDRARLDA